MANTDINIVNIHQTFTLHEENIVEEENVINVILNS
jgi:hypothetical protein